MRFYDAHNHWQDERLRPHREAVLAAQARAPVAAMVVNGAAESDWPEVRDLARQHAWMRPAFGYHPWYVAERTPRWQETLAAMLEEPGASVGEIGLDHWITPRADADQEAVFLWQWRLAAERNLPVSLHGLRAWGRLAGLMRQHPGPARGFLLHSYGGPPDLIPELVEQGAYFSFPGLFAQDRKLRQRETFRQVPRERLLIETDAPDQLLPDVWNEHPLADAATGKPLNHPANLEAVYRYAAHWLEQPIASLAAQVEANFHRLFGERSERV